MIDIFQNYALQREELLARIAEELQLDKTRLERMETSYKAVFDFLDRHSKYFENFEIEVYAQGSKRIGTTVKPINKKDFDLDVVLHIYDPYYNHSPKKIYDELVKALEEHEYYKTIMEKKNRCVRLNYKDDFHMDILPACMPDYSDKQNIKIPEKSLNDWSSGNPKGYAEWFLNIANSVKMPMLKKFSKELIEAKIETEPLSDELYMKLPLQRAVQLFKRYRDVYFENREYPVSSVVITTLVASAYQNEDSIFDTIDNALKKIKNDYLYAINNNIRFKIVNPVNPMEDFTDFWTDKHYDSFYKFIVDFYDKWQTLKNSFETGKEDYIKLFGEGVYKKSLTQQFKVFSHLSSDNLVKNSGLIISGKAFTNSVGDINVNQGIKNEYHRNFGG